MLVSVVIRTLNEEKYLEELLSSIKSQESDVFTIETVVVDSGSTDRTLEISSRYGARVTFIKKEDFSFGRSLNIGCDFANGEILIFVSGHCVSASNRWIHELCMPIYEGSVEYAYGRQIGRDTTKFSERQVFDKYFPSNCILPQEGFFCNNANSALLRSTWSRFRFDEELTGLEDMHLAKQVVESGGLIGYVSTAPVYHIHDESWGQVERRYEREAIALRNINPEIQMTFGDFCRCFFAGAFSDFSAALRDRVFFQEVIGIICFRFLQYWGGYKGNHIHRKLSKEAKQKYFYPKKRVTEKLEIDKDEKNYRANASEGK